MSEKDYLFTTLVLMVNEHKLLFLFPEPNIEDDPGYKELEWYQSFTLPPTKESQKWREIPTMCGEWELEQGSPMDPRS